MLVTFFMGSSPNLTSGLVTSMQGEFVTKEGVSGGSIEGTEGFISGVTEAIISTVNETVAAISAQVSEEL